MRGLARVRREKGVTQAELEMMTGIHRVTISRYETGDTEPGAVNLKKLADALGCTMEALLADAGDEDAPAADKPGGA